MKGKKICVFAGAVCLFLWACSGARKEGQEARKVLPEQQTEAQTERMTEAQAQSAPPQTQAEAAQGGGIEKVKAQLGWNPGQSKTLEEVQALLEENQVPYTAYYNYTRERLDMELEDGFRLLFIELSTEMGEYARYEMVMKGDELNYYGFQEGYFHQYDVTIDEEFFPQTRQKVLAESQLGALTLTDLSIARNEMFARRGRIFKDSFLNALFRQKSWYQPVYEGAEYDQKAEPLSQVEARNLELIISQEECQHKDWAWKDLCSGSWLDLNGDGRKEKIGYEVRINPGSTEAYTLTVNGRTRTGEGENLYPYVGVLELDENTRLLVAGQNGPSDDPFLDIYRYDGENLILAGAIPGAFYGQEGNRFSVGAQTDFFQTAITTVTYYLDETDCRIKQEPQEFYPYGNTATALKEIQLYQDKGGTNPSVAIGIGEAVKIVGTDMETAVKIEKSSTGETGWLPCRTPYYCRTKDGGETESWELFDGLPFFG